jgi:hypothetical protein
MSEAVKRSVRDGGRATVIGVGLRPVCASMTQAFGQILARCAGRHSPKQGVTGFVQKRKPVFEGI